MTLGERLRQKRKEKKLTQMDVAKMLGIDNTTVSKWESDVYEPDATTLKKLADLYNTTTDYLTGRSDDPSPSGADADEFDDPEIGLWFKDLKNASPEELRKLKQIWDLINEKEKDRKPGQKQGE